MANHLSEPPKWNDDQLNHDRLFAIGEFIKRRSREGTTRYEKMFAEHQPIVERLFRETEDIRKLRGLTFQNGTELLLAARFLAAPHISEDDLNILAGGNLKKKKVIEPDLAQRAADVIISGLDPIRLPWLREQRVPTPAERTLAILWTCGVLTIERLRTRRRVESSKRQEQSVRHGIKGLGLRETPVKQIEHLDDLQRGAFAANEYLLAGSNCDILIRLEDGRLLALECKVSNSKSNSVKRLNRETGGKADLWRRAFGEQVLPGAVLSGVFRLKNLQDAQRSRIALFWDHKLSELFSFIESAR